MHPVQRIVLGRGARRTENCRQATNRQQAAQQPRGAAPGRTLAPRRKLSHASSPRNEADVNTLRAPLAWRLHDFNSHIPAFGGPAARRMLGYNRPYAGMGSGAGKPGVARKFHRLNGEQDLKYGQYLSLPRMALQPLRRKTG